MFVPGANWFIPGIDSGFGGSYIHGGSYVFMSALPTLPTKENNFTKEDFKHRFNLSQDDQRITLILSKKVLNKLSHYHLNTQDQYGSKESSIEGNNIEKFTQKISLIHENEIVIQESVNFTYLKEIWVLPTMRNKLIKLLKNHNIQFDEKKIKAYDNFPESLCYSPN